MVDIAGASLGSMNVMGIVAQIVVFLFYGVIALVFGGILFFTLHVFSFKFKATEIQLVGSGTEDGFSVGKVKKNRFKWNKSKTAWRPLYPLFKKLEVEPFDPRYVYNGNMIYAFKYGEEYIPGSVNISKSESHLVANIDPVPHSIRSWSALEDERIEKEFQKQDFWTQNKMLLLTIGTVLICGAIAVATIWLSYKFAAGGVSATERLTSVLEGMGNTIK